MNSYSYYKFAITVAVAARGCARRRPATARVMCLLFVTLTVAEAPAAHFSYYFFFLLTRRAECSYSKRKAASEIKLRPYHSLVALLLFSLFTEFRNKCCSFENDSSSNLASHSCPATVPVCVYSASAA